jgi:hypothetical protein
MVGLPGIRDAMEARKANGSPVGSQRVNGA